MEIMNQEIADGLQESSKQTTGTMGVDMLGSIPEKFSVIPVRNKIPLVKWQDFIDRKATQNEKEIWVKTFEAFDWGIVTGPISGILVLDIDGEQGLIEARKQGLPRTPFVKTRKGYHYYFRWTEELNNKVTTRARIGTELDVRGDSGYVVFYGWALAPYIAPLASPPKWLVDLLPAKNDPFRRGIGNATSTKPDNWFAEALNGLKEGNRNETFTKLAGSLRARGYSVSDIFGLLKGAALEVAFPLTELETIANSVGRYTPSTVTKQTNAVEPFRFEANQEEYFKELLMRSRSVKPEFCTGFPSLDFYTRGLPRKNLYVIGAPTNGGKTQFVLSMILNLLQQKKRVLFFSTEMPQNEIRDRINAIGASVPISELVTGRLDDENRDKLSKFLGTFDFSGLYISPDDQPTLETITKAIDTIKPDVFVLDHIHHVRLTQENRRLEIDSFIMGLKEIVLKYDMPGVITAQLKRKEPLKPDEPIRYSMHDFKESGGIENEAGVCVLLCPPTKWTEERLQRVTGYLPKNRHGRREVRFSLDFDTKNITFTEPE